MDLTITTPALLFPAISLLFLAYTNRFMHLAALARNLYDRYAQTPSPNTKGQLDNLRYRLRLIRDMQVFAVSSFFGCALSMFVLFLGQNLPGAVIFGLSLVLLLVSLGISLREIQVSVNAITLQFSDLDEAPPSP